MGLAALATLSSANSGPSREPARQIGQPGVITPHLPARRSASSGSTWPAGLSHLETLRLQAEARARCTASRCPSRSRRGSRSRSFRGPSCSCFGPQHRVPEVRQVGAGDRARSFRTSARIADDICIVRSLQDRGDQSRPGPHVHEHRHDDLRPAGDGLVALLRPGQRERRPARLRRAHLDRAASASRSRSPRGNGTAAFCRAGSRASSSAARATRSSTSPTRRASTPTQQRDVVDAVQAAQPPAERRRRRSRDRHAHRPVRDGLPHADQRAGPDGLLAASRSTSSTCTARSGADGSFAANCLLARRLAERGVRFIQLYHRDWDHHGGVKDDIAAAPAKSTRRAAALITDLKQRGMLDDTLIVWGGEFGRTPMAQGNGRDHHIKGFSMWLAGGGIKGGITLRRDRRARLQRRRERRPRPRPARHDAAPPGHRPPAADVPLPGPRLPPDRRERQRGGGDSGVVKNQCKPRGEVLRTPGIVQHPRGSEYLTPGLPGYL